MDNEALLDYLIQMGAIQQQDAELQRRRARIDALRGSPAQGRMVGGHYVSASPLSHLSNALGEGMAGYQEAKLEQDERALGERRSGMLGQMRQRRGAAPRGIDRGAPGWYMTPEI